MKYLKITALLGGLLAVGALALPVFAANPYDWNLNIDDSGGTPTPTSIQADFGDTGERILSMNGVSKLPHLTGLEDPELIIEADGKLGVGNLDEGNVANLTADLTGKANVSHTHSTSDIVGLGTYVDGRIAFAASSSPALGFGTTTRALNTAFRISSSSAAMVTYTVDISSTLSLTSGQTGTVTLEYADDSGFTSNVKTVQSSANGNTGTLAIGLGLTQTSTASLTGIIPAGKWVQVSTTNTVGSPTFTYRSQQEVILNLK